MKASTLTLLIVVYSILGALLALVTRGAWQGSIAATTGVALAVTLGALWPSHREFTIAGVVLGALLALSFALYVIVTWEDRVSLGGDNARRVFAQGVTVGMMTYGAWMTMMTLGAGTACLARRIFRHSFAEGQA